MCGLITARIRSTRCTRSTSPPSSTSCSCCSLSSWWLPLATVDIAVNLPASTAEPQPRPERPLYLTVKSDLTLALGENPVSRDLLGGTLDAAANGDKDTRIFLRADKAVPYGEMMEVMNLLRAAGYLKVALVGLEKTQ